MTWWTKQLRDFLCFAIGAAGLTREIILGAGAPERPYLIGACLVLLGLPGALRIDEIRRKGNGEDDQ